MRYYVRPTPTRTHRHALIEGHPSWTTRTRACLFVWRDSRWLTGTSDSEVSYAVRRACGRRPEGRLSVNRTAEISARTRLFRWNANMLKHSSQPACWITGNAGPCDQCGTYCEHLVHVQLDLRLLCLSCCPHCSKTAPRDGVARLSPGRRTLPIRSIATRQTTPRDLGR